MRRTTHIDISSGSQCYAIRYNKDRVPLAWFRWNLFPYSLAEEARRWFALASFEVKGNWDDLIKKFCERFFPLSKVQHNIPRTVSFHLTISLHKYI